VRRRALARGLRDRDRGVVAIIVALMISSVLLTISAFAVDFGNALAERARLMAVADLAAKAGAVYLPDVAKARAAAVNTICSTENRAPDWASACAGAPAWASNLLGGVPDLSDGDVSFFGDDADGDHAPSPGELLTGAWATAIMVTLPPASVPVGLGQIAGVSSISVGALGTARLATPMPSLGIAPFYLAPTDLLLGSGAGAQVCFLFGGLTNPVPTGAGGLACNPVTGVVTSQRGVVSEPHSGFTGINTIRENLRTGIDHTIHAYPYWKCAGATAGLLGNCLPLPPTSATCATLPAGNIFSTAGGPVPDVNCLGVDSDISGGTGEQREIRRGLLRISVPGRLQEPTCGGTIGSVHGYANADNNDLFTAGRPWVNPAVTQADLDAAKAAMIAGQPNPLPVRPFTAEIFNCARFSVVPILPTAIATPVAALTFLPVEGFRYLWIGSDDEPPSLTNGCTSTENGLIWRAGTFGCLGSTTTLVGVRAYVFNTSYLPQTPQTTLQPGPYLGPDLASVSGLANNPPT
jgi:hypothetical protein